MAGLNGYSQISGGDIVITTLDRLAGAIGSLKWNGKEFISATSTGDDLQGAVFYGPGGDHNPTEAGTFGDLAGPTSSSVLLAISAVDNVLTTQIRMAYFVPVDGVILTNDIMAKTVRIGFLGYNNIVEFLSTFSFPELHAGGSVIEGPTGYMLAEFSKVWTYNPATGTLTPVSGSANQSLPVIISTVDEANAMGIFSPEASLYGYFDVPSLYPNVMSKWNAIFFTPEAAGNYSFRSYIAVGSLATVQSLMTLLYNYFRPAPPPFSGAYMVNGQSLDDIFMARVSSPIANTGFTRGGVDLAQLYEGGDDGATETHFKVGGSDLNRLFRKKT